LILYNFFSSPKCLIYILLFALLTRLTLFTILKPWDERVVSNQLLVSDAASYQFLALNLLNTGTFKGDSYNKYRADPGSLYFIYNNYDTYRTPLYTLFLAGIYFIFGPQEYVAILFQIIISLVSIFVLYKLSISLFHSHFMASVTSFLFAVDPHQIFYTLNILTDTLFVCILLTSAYMFFRGIQKEKIAIIIVSALLLGFSTLTRAISIFLPLVYLILIFFSAGKKMQWKLKSAFVFCAVFMLTIFPWLQRNHREYGHYAISSQGGQSLLMYNVVYTEVNRTGRIDSLVINDFQKRAIELGIDKTSNPFDKSNIYNAIAKKYILEHLFFFCQKHVEGIFNMFIGLGSHNIASFFGAEEPVLSHKNTYSLISHFDKTSSLFKGPSFLISSYIVLFLLVCYSLVLPGMYWMLKDNNMYILMFLLLHILYFSMLIGIIGISRYKLPITPFYLIICGYAVGKLAKNSKGFSEENNIP
jgi:4-amino-4-deoxy-L-arabinose transferase-like glycosyltransferase